LGVIPWEYEHYAGPIPRNGPLAWVGLALFAAGALLSAWAMRALHGAYTARLNVAAGQALVTAGPYAIVRNPGYFGNILTLLGLGLALSSLVGIALAVVTAIGILIRIRREEQMLLAEFGDKYRAYMQRTHRLFPLVY
jgi:protein-S-isoprenylcysteine O-methyltransferase Ste14